MAQEKKSFKHVKVIKKSQKKKGNEFGAIIANDSKNYPQTGQWRDQIPVVDKQKCIGCAMCSKHCPEKSISIKKIGGKNKSVIDYQFCKGCGICENVCPVKAIEMMKQ